MPKTGRPKREFDKKAFIDLVGLGVEADGILWYFRDPDTQKPANQDTLSRWCKREFGCTYQDYFRQNKGMSFKIKLLQNQLKLSEKSAAMAIWLGKQYLGQRDVPLEVEHTVSPIDEITQHIFKLQQEQAAQEQAAQEDETEE